MLLLSFWSSTDPVLIQCFFFYYMENGGQYIPQNFTVCVPQKKESKFMLAWNNMNRSFDLVLIGVCFYNGSVLWVNHYRRRYVCRVESQWLKRERNTPPVWMINTSRWMATVFAAIYFSGWSNYLLCGSSLMPLTKKNQWRDGKPANLSYIIRPSALEWHMCCTTALHDRCYTNFNNIYSRSRVGNNAGRRHIQYLLFNLA